MTVLSYTRDYVWEEPARQEVDGWSGLVLLEFGATWCPICQALQPALARLLEERPDIRHVKVEDGRGKPLGRSFRVKLWPNLVFLKDGQVQAQLVRPGGDEVAAALSEFVA